MSAGPEVLFEEIGRAGLITLNRPKALNALTLTMIREIHARLRIWADEPGIERVVIRGSGDKAFCAGGDIRQLREWGLAGDPNAIAFYREEYRLNAFIKHYPKPYIALVDGIVMGGGVGVAMHGKYVLCSERTVFAMPETGIGLFPDVGATYFLPRLPGSLGTYLALTGARLRQADLQWCGIATHSFGRDTIDLLVADLAEESDLDEVCARHASPTSEPTLRALMPAIDRCFSVDSIYEVPTRLNNEAGEHAEWAAGINESLLTKSPISLHIAFRQMREGRKVEFDECMRIEFRIVNRVLNGTDFYEGVRAVIIDKDNRPQWTHQSLDAVAQKEIDRYFESLGNGELKLN